MIIARAGSNGYENALSINLGDRWMLVRGTERIADLVGQRELGELATAAAAQLSESETIAVDLDVARPIADRDADIWGAGLNYQGHSNDLETTQPQYGPGSYLRPGGCLVANGADVVLPRQSSRVTAEAELGLVVGTMCKNVKQSEWRSVVAGVTVVLDLTAEDAIRENPRYIPWAKGFDTFCSIGPTLTTLDEFGTDELDSLQISTIRNGETVASATPLAMKYGVPALVEHFSAGRTLRPGTIICTGTPGAAVINSGDVITATVDRLGSLTHGVR